MLLKEIGTAESWEEALKRTSQLLEEGKLTLITAVTEDEFDSDELNPFVLEELRATVGATSCEELLRQMTQNWLKIHGEQSNMMLYHGRHVYERDSKTVDGWILVIIF